MLEHYILIGFSVLVVLLLAAVAFWPMPIPGPPPPPPADAIAVPRSDGSPYLHVWRDTQNARIKMRFASCPRVIICWDSKITPGLLSALQQLNS